MANMNKSKMCPEHNDKEKLYCSECVDLIVDLTSRTILKKVLNEVKNIIPCKHYDACVCDINYIQSWLEAEIKRKRIWSKK